MSEPSSTLQPSIEPDTDSPPPPATETATPKRAGRRKPRADTKPKARRAATTAKPSGKVKPSTQEIADALSEVLTIPAVPYSMMGADYPAEHVVRTGPALALQLARMSEQNTWLRSKLEAFATGDHALGFILLTAMLTMSVAEYVIPQLAYFGVLPPTFAPRFGGKEIGATTPAPTETETAPVNGSAPDVPPMQDLMAMAASMVGDMSPEDIAMAQSLMANLSTTQGAGITINDIPDDGSEPPPAEQNEQPS